MNVHLVFRAIMVASLGALIAGCAVDGENDAASEEKVGATSQAITSTLLSSSPPADIVLSTGNIYFTANSFSDLPLQWVGSVYRAAKTNVPGNEQLLYQERSSTSRVVFGSLTYANPGTWYGYFAASYDGSYQIKRVPLAGGTAATLATFSSASAAGGHTLDNDGTFLYWADSVGVRKMTLGGSSVTTLASMANIRSLAIDATSVYFASGNAIYRVPKVGGSLVTVATGQNKINAIDVVPGATTRFYWAEQGGRIAAQAVGGLPQTIHTPTGTYDARSVSYDGTRVLWTECKTGVVTPCYVYSLNGAALSSLQVGLAPSHVRGDANYIFWGGTGGVFRATH